MLLVPRQIKPRILKLTTRRVQSNLPTVFIFVSCEGKDYYRVVSVGQVLTAARTAGTVAVCKALAESPTRDLQITTYK